MQLALFLQQNQIDPAEAQKIALAFLAVFPILMIIGLAVVIIPTWFVCKKAGFSPWLSLLVIVPFGGIILLYVLAFADWKVAPIAASAYPTSYPPQPPYPPHA
jgi:intracellular septation protein A